MFDLRYLLCLKAGGLNSKKLYSSAQHLPHLVNISHVAQWLLLSTAATAADEATVSLQYGSGIQAEAFKGIIGHFEK